MGKSARYIRTGGRDRRVHCTVRIVLTARPCHPGLSSLATTLVHHRFTTTSLPVITDDRSTRQHNTYPAQSYQPTVQGHRVSPYPILWHIPVHIHRFLNHHPNTTHPPPQALSLSSCDHGVNPRERSGNLPDLRNDLPCPLPRRSHARTHARTQPKQGQAAGGMHVVSHVETANMVITRDGRLSGGKHY